MQRLMTAKQAANYLGLNVITVYRLANQGKIPAGKFGGEWRFKKEVIDEWVSNARPSTKKFKNT